MGFYPNLKPHISPSAFAQWHRQRSAFVRSYFKGEKTPETQAMKAGTKIHGLIEAGFLPAIHRFENAEQTLNIFFGNGVYQLLGIPDSYGLVDGVAHFVDYKTGKENHWTREELATDLKMLCTAWLVWNRTQKPKAVRGIIEWIGTTWNGNELVPLDQDHICVEYIYTEEVLESFEATLVSTVEEINTEHIKFLQSTGEFVSDKDCAEYAGLEAQKKEIENKQKEIKDRIQEQMEFGGVSTFSTDFGTFYITETKKYEYPSTLRVEYHDMGLVLEDAEEIAAIASAVKKNYELVSSPKLITHGIGFRAKREKK